MLHRAVTAIAGLFRRADGRVAWPVVVAFVAINLLVLVNDVLHDPRVGYDAAGHRAYARVLSTGRLPSGDSRSRDYTHEFFSPPLPYAPAAIAGRFVRSEYVALKVAQLAQAGYSVALTLAVLAIVRRVRPGDAFAAGAALLCLGMVPAYYRSFAMVRGEPLLATCATVGAWLTFRVFAGERRPSVVGAALAGLAIGAACASRQWAFFLLPGLGLVGLWRLIVDPPNRAATLRAGLATIALAALVGGPWYVYLRVHYGKLSAFNRTESSLDAPDEMVRGDEPTTIDVEPRRPKPIDPTTFGEALHRLVTRPVRDAFADRRALLFYADAWGDYWQYYLFDATEKKGRRVMPGRIGDATARPGVRSNYAEMSAYLGRVSVASVVPTVALLAGLGAAVASIRRTPRSLDRAADVVLPAVGVMIVGSLAGYTWFVTTYLGDRGDTVKATYLLQVVPLMAIVTAALLGEIKARSPRAAWTVIAILLVAFAHNLPACVTHTVGGR